jgi:trehalose synthase
MLVEEVPVGAQSLDRYRDVVDAEVADAAISIAETVRDMHEGRVIWNVNSTALGGGVAEMLRALLPYVRGFGIDTRWLVLGGNEDFFRITKRLHHALHGSEGDGSPLGENEREIYESVLFDNAAELNGRVRKRDIMILHDPQTAGLIPHMKRAGAVVIWRCHVGADTADEQTKIGWDFLAPYMEDAAAMLFSRNQYIPDCCDHNRSLIIPPSIDPFSPKNQHMSEPAVRSILVNTGIIEGPPGEVPPIFQREDGSPGRVDRQADVVRHGRAPTWETPLVVQVSRWDPLKDPVGVIEGYLEYLRVASNGSNAQLVLAGPSVHAVTDDLEQAATYDQVLDKWRDLPHGVRNRVHLACLPMADIDENAAIVNALQTHAAAVIQKSLAEGFGLTVTEAMWKARPVLASAVGGISDQIDDGVHGLLLKDPRDVGDFAEKLDTLLSNPDRAAALGSAARERVKERYLGLTSLITYAQLITRLTS